jgi:CheY-like chemotaxis protein
MGFFPLKTVITQWLVNICCKQQPALQSLLFCSGSSLSYPVIHSPVPLLFINLICYIRPLHINTTGMNNNGPIIIIEDDKDDQMLLTEVFNKLNYPNEPMFFTDGEAALNFLNDTDIVPFLILSDINLPKLDGFALRSKIKMDAKLQLKCIPYLFFSTASNQRAVIDAYSLSVQGFFIKQSRFEELEKTIVVIMEYWKRCASPNNF